MRNRLLTALLLFIAVMLDTTVLPTYIRAPWLMPLSLSLVYCLGASQGRYMGLIAGLGAGLLIDILVGYPLGIRLFQYMGAGLLTGIVVPIPPAILERRGFDRRALLVRLLLFTAPSHLLAEAAVLVYQYFNTARFLFAYAENALLRTGVLLLLNGALLLPLMKLLPSPLYGETAERPKKEARHF